MNKALCSFAPRSSLYVSGYPLCTPLGFKSKYYLLYWLHIYSNIESLPNPKMVTKMIEYVRKRKAEVSLTEMFMLTLVIWMLLTLQIFLDLRHQWGWHRGLKQLPAPALEGHSMKKGRPFRKCKSDCRWQCQEWASKQSNMALLA